MKDSCFQKVGLLLKGTAKDVYKGGQKQFGKLIAVGALVVAQGQAFALTNSVTTALALTENIEDSFDTGATIGLGIVGFLLALGFVLKGIRVAHRG